MDTCVSDGNTDKPCHPESAYAYENTTRKSFVPPHFLLQGTVMKYHFLRGGKSQEFLQKAVNSFVKAGGRELKGADIFECSTTVVR